MPSNRPATAGLHGHNWPACAPDGSVAPLRRLSCRIERPNYAAICASPIQYCADLAHLEGGIVSGGETLLGLARLLSTDRNALLQRLKEVGVTRLPERQKLANAISRARREGRLAAE